VHRGGAAMSGGASMAGQHRRVRARGRPQAVPAAPLPCDGGTGTVTRRREAAEARVNGGGTTKDGGGAANLGFGNGVQPRGLAAAL
jgi:hypothetical protein